MAAEPGFFALFDYLVAQMAANRGLAEAMAGGGFDVAAAAARSELDLLGVEHSSSPRPSGPEWCARG